MVNLTRRSFLGGVLSVVAVSIVTPPKFSTYPTLYGDNPHDDTKALQAVFNGEPYIVEGKLIKGQESVVFGGGVYKISDTLFIRKSNTKVHDITFVKSNNFEGPVLDIDKVSNCVFDSVHVWTSHDKYMSGLCVTNT